MSNEETNNYNIPPEFPNRNVTEAKDKNYKSQNDKKMSNDDRSSENKAKKQQESKQEDDEEQENQNKWM